METNYKLPNALIKALAAAVFAFVALAAVDKGYDVVKHFQGSIPENTISISADGRVSAIPDLAIMNLGVTTQGSNAKDVQDQNSKKAAKVIEFIKKQGIEEKDITTSQFSIFPNYNYQSGKNEIIGYQATQTVSVKVRQVDTDSSLVGKILDGATDNGANEVQGVNFTFDDPDNLKQQARLLAVDNAKQKAAELAQMAGLKLGKVVSVAEGASTFPLYADGKGGGGALFAPEINPGTQEITQSVTVTFEVK